MIFFVLRSRLNAKDNLHDISSEKAKTRKGATC